MWSSSRKRRVLTIVGIGASVLAGLALGGLLVAWSGVYSVAASLGHWAIVERFLAFGMRNSVKTHAMLVQAPPLDSPDLVRLGAGHFHDGCAYCHGAPGMPINPVAGQMLPPPPPLSDAVVLLRHKARREARVELRAQHGHLGSVRAIATASLRWMVAIELGTWRCGRIGGAAGSVTVG